MTSAAGRTGVSRQDFARIRYVDARGGEQRTGLPEASGIRFEDCRVARNIPSYRNAAHTPGRYWSATTGELVEYESHLEEKWLTLLDFDTAVTGFSSQPMELQPADAHGAWSHFPDIFARRGDGSALLLDVKNPRRIDSPDVRLQAARTRALCERLGWAYDMVAEPDPQLWANVSELSGKRRPLHLGEDLVPQLLDLARTPRPLADLASAMPYADLARGVILHLCWRQDLLFDLARPLRDSTLLRASPAAASGTGSRG